MSIQRNENENENEKENENEYAPSHNGTECEHV